MLVITAVEIEGFKSFGSPGVVVKLSPLNFIVGPNASGKTNFISAFRFLQNAVRQNAEFAVNELGGATEVRNKLQRQRKEDKHLRLHFRTDDEARYHIADNRPPGTIRNFDYTLVIDLRTPDDVPLILEERLQAEVDTDEESKPKPYVLDRNTERVAISDPLHSDQQEREFPVPDQESSRPALAVGFFSLPCVLFKHQIEAWTFFNISPHVARQPYRAIPEAKLGPYGENLAVVLRNLEKRNGKKHISALVAGLRSIIPGFQDVRAVQDGLENKWALRIVEEKIKALSPGSVSDGTIRLLTLMVIAQLGVERRALIAIKEPENGVHPHLSEHLVNVFRETSRESQIIATTHNPAFLDHLQPCEVLLCGKKDGFTQVQRADDWGEIKSFQKHFTLGELWTQGTFDGFLE